MKTYKANSFEQQTSEIETLPLILGKQGKCALTLLTPRKTLIVIRHQVVYFSDNLIQLYQADARHILIPTLVFTFLFI